jgi:hypothetical protein
LASKGAVIDLESTAGLPPAFDLLIESEQFRRRCRVVWLQKARIGVVFDNPRNSQTPPP